MIARTRAARRQPASTGLYLFALLILVYATATVLEATTR